MAVNQPNITLELETSEDCTTVTLVDATGEYDVNTNPLGYGLPDGVASNDVEVLKILMTLNRQGITLEYNFTIVSRAITAATLSLSGATPVSILTSLSSTVFPFESANSFDLFGDYGVTIPDLVDEVITVEYEITGNADVGGSPESFDFVVTNYKGITCNTECCKKQYWLGIDPLCSCKSDKIKAAMLLETHLKQVTFAAEDGDVARAVIALNQAEKYCSTCEDGCSCA